MLNKKFIFIFACLLNCFFTYAESGINTCYGAKRPHHEFTVKNNGKQSLYRIQMDVSHYAFYIDAESCNQVECFPNYEMGISRESGDKNYRSQLPNYCALWIFPDIILKNEKEVFSVKGSLKEEGYLLKCYASDWEIYEKGVMLDILLLDVYENRYKSNKVKKFYLELKDDGKYYEAENAENFGKLKKRYSSYDFLDRIVSYEYRRNFNFFGYSIYKMKDRKNIESEFISDILFYNATETGIEFITPYGCGFFDFNTESMSLVPKEKYIGKEFIYTIYYRNGSWKYKEKRKVITEADFILPDIKIPLSTYDLDLYYREKLKDNNQKEQEQQLNFD